ncbi:MAG TPA: hypothetical protein VGM27_16995 [Acidobacteriaceae bacterium]
MGDQHCREAAGTAALQAQTTATELFQIAALILGSEEEAITMVEETVARAEIDPCADAGGAHDEARQRLVDFAVRRLAKLHPGAFAAPPSIEGTATCIETDDLSAAGLSTEQLDALFEGSGRAKMREWLDQLAPAVRAIFVLRAVVGQDGERTAQDLRRSGAVGAQGWQREQVGTAYRQALCSLATSLMSSNLLVSPA